MMGFPGAGAVRDSRRIPWIFTTLGFLFASFAIVVAMSSSITLAWKPWPYIGVGLGVAAALADLKFRMKIRQRASFCVAMLTLVVIYVASLLTWHDDQKVAKAASDHVLTISVLLAIPNVIATLIAYRVHPIFYLPIVIAVGIANAVGLDTPWWGLANAVLLVMLLLTTNFMVQFVLDHRWEWVQWKQRGSFRQAGLVLVKSAVPWLLAAGAAAAGACLYQKLQSAVRFQFYASGAVLQDPSAGSSGFDLKRDIEYTLGNNQERDESLVYAQIDAGSKDMASVYKNAPKVVSDNIQSYRPPPIKDSPCDGIHWSVQWLLRGICQGFFSSMNKMISDAFESIHDQTTAYVEGRTKALAAQHQHSLQEGQKLANDAVRWEYAGYFTVMDYAFAYLRIANWISWVYVIGSLIAILQWFACRTAFHGQGPTFRLSGLIAGDKTLDMQVGSKIYLNHYPYSIWYVVKKGLNAKGDGMAERNCPTQAHRCTLSRLLAGKLFLSKALIAPAPASSAPRISVEKPRSLVVIKLQPGQRLVFRLKQLAAFSEGVSLRSTYSVHAAMDFLRLKRFYASAQGPGHIVLLASGDIALLDNGAKASSADLLAWDIRASFSLDQASTGIGMWVNDPRLHVRTAEKSVVAESAEENGSSLTSKLFRLLRFGAISW